MLSIDLWGIELQVVRSARSLVDSSSHNSLFQHLFIYIEFNHLIDSFARLLEHDIELLGLSSGSGETVKEHASLALWLVHIVLEQFDHKLI